jgi:hypothetical protein
MPIFQNCNHHPKHHLSLSWCGSQQGELTASIWVRLRAWWPHASALLSDQRMSEVLRVSCDASGGWDRAGVNDGIIYDEHDDRKVRQESELWTKGIYAVERFVIVALVSNASHLTLECSIHSVPLARIPSSQHCLEILARRHDLSIDEAPKYVCHCVRNLTTTHNSPLNVAYLLSVWESTKES